MPCALDPGDLEIAVEWFQRDVSGGDERRIFLRLGQLTETLVMLGP